MSVIQNKKFLDKHLKSLRGAKVLDAYAYTEDEFDDDEFYPLLILDCADKKIRAACIQRDAECNGPGFLQIDEIPEDLAEHLRSK